MGIDIHIHDQYFVVASIPTALAFVVAALLVVFGAWKLAKAFWLMMAG